MGGFFFLFLTLPPRRIHFCQTGPGSQGVREFVKRNYKDLKVKNPTLPILIRECSGVEAKAWMRFGQGVEKSATLEGMDAAGVDKALAALL